MKQKNDSNSPKGRLVKVDGVQFQLIDGKLYRYADLTMDKGFKIVFGQIGSEELLKNLLNRLLGTRISRLTYRNTEHPGMTEDERESRFDVYCEDEAGNCFEVEMQNWSQKYINKRAVYYSSLVVLDQATRAVEKAKMPSRDSRKKWDYDFKPLYVVCFLNFNSRIPTQEISQRNEYISKYRYINKETGSELGDGTNIVFVDLHNFTKEIDECNDLKDIWIYSIRNMLEMHKCPDKIIGSEVEELFKRAELAKMTLKQRIILEESIMTQNDILNSVAEQLEEARAIAIAEGRAEGRDKERKHIIRLLLESGLSPEKIADMLKMEVEDVKTANDLD